ncbi:MAG: mono/diheme cytochrome c family protein [Rhodothermales bacterium]|jgi:mono/diheme cytochrome c family protein
MHRPLFLLLLLSLVASAKVKPDPDRWRDWLEDDTRFFSATVDARDGLKDNLTPRGLVLALGDQHYACFDVDLLRMAAIWRADSAEVPFDYAGMAVYSYPKILRKVMGGQKNLPSPIGTRLLESPRLPGISIGPARLSDPRPRVKGADDTGRGRLPDGRFLGIDLSQGVTLDYRIGDVLIRERVGADSNGIWRQWRIAPHTNPLSILLGKSAKSASLSGPCELRKNGALSIAHLPAAAAPTVVTYRLGTPQIPAASASPARWSEPVAMPLAKSADFKQFKVDYIGLPNGERTLRPSGIDFFADGRAAVVTFDGDIWIGSDLHTDTASWRRFASGLHEPLSIGIRHGEIFVFDRSGLWRIDDRDGDGEADYHSLFCAELQQSAETREMAKSMVIQNDGSFLVCKPGQSGGSPQAGHVLWVSPDGTVVRSLGYGFRQPMLGYDPVSDEVTVTDQQGHYVPSTPVHVLQRDQPRYHGFLPAGLPPETHPEIIEPPAIWVQHRACQGASTVVSMRSSQMGPLADRSLLLSFTPPTLLDVFHDGEQGGVNSLPLKLDIAPLNGAVNPKDGLFYVSGFVIWGSVASNPAGIARVRPLTDTPWPLPANARATKRGILLSYAAPQDDSAAERAQYELRRWNYKRSKAYGSAHYKLNGEKGEDSLPISSIKISADRRQIFLGVPDMREAMQVFVKRDKSETFLTVHRLLDLDLTAEGFADNTVDLAASPIAKSADEPASLQLGKSLYAQLGCVACHSTDGSAAGRTGPSWKALSGATREIIGGATITADDAYLRESILDPQAKVAKGAVNGEAGMPIYAGILSDSQVDSLILYIRSLK